MRRLPFRSAWPILSCARSISLQCRQDGLAGVSKRCHGMLRHASTQTSTTQLNPRILDAIIGTHLSHGSVQAISCAFSLDVPKVSGNVYDATGSEQEVLTRTVARSTDWTSFTRHLYGGRYVVRTQSEIKTVFRRRIYTSSLPLRTLAYSMALPEKPSFDAQATPLPLHA